MVFFKPKEGTYNINFPNFVTNVFPHIFVPKSRISIKNKKIRIVFDILSVINVMLTNSFVQQHHSSIRI